MDKGVHEGVARTRALLDWFYAEEIPPVEAIPIMAAGIVACVSAIAEVRQGRVGVDVETDIKRGLEAVANGIKNWDIPWRTPDTLENAEKNSEKKLRQK
jgi:hypothetical protein